MLTKATARCGSGGLGSAEMTSPTSSPRSQRRPWSDRQTSGSSANAGVVGVDEPPPGSTVKRESSTRQVRKHRGGRRRDGIGIHGACRLRAVLADQPHLVDGARLRWRDVVHHQHPCVLLVGEHHGGGAAGRHVTRDGPHVRGGEDLLRGRCVGAGRNATRPDCAEPNRQYRGGRQKRRAPAIRRCDDCWRLDRRHGASNRSRSSAGGSTAVAAETSAMVSRTARTSSANATATSAVRRRAGARCRRVRSRSARAARTALRAPAGRDPVARSSEPQTLRSPRCRRASGT